MDISAQRSQCVAPDRSVERIGSVTDHDFHFRVGINDPRREPPSGCQRPDIKFLPERRGVARSRQFLDSSHQRHATFDLIYRMTAPFS